jgi:hypothetical protein
LYSSDERFNSVSKLDEPVGQGLLGLRRMTPPSTRTGAAAVVDHGRTGESQAGIDAEDAHPSGIPKSGSIAVCAAGDVGKKN